MPLKIWKDEGYVRFVDNEDEGCLLARSFFVQGAESVYLTDDERPDWAVRFRIEKSELSGGKIPDAIRSEP